MANAPTRDATFKASSFSTDFNDPSNWEEGYVPTGVATIPLAVWGPLRFSKPATTFSSFNTLGGCGFIIDAGQTVTLTGDGVVPHDRGPKFGVFGALNGNVHLKGPPGFSHPVLYGTGTINGDVENVGGVVNPGRDDYGGTGTLTINGSYLQSARPNVFSTLMIGAVPGQPAAKLSVTKRTTLVKDDNSSLMIVMDNPANTTFTALASGSLTGVFGSIGSTRPVKPDVRYDDKNVTVTV
jgi:hypothetical protein